MRITVNTGMSLSANPTKLKADDAPESKGKKEAKPPVKGKAAKKPAAKPAPAVFPIDKSSILRRSLLSWLGLKGLSQVNSITDVSVMYDGRKLTFTRTDVNKVVKTCGADSLPDFLGNDTESKLAKLRSSGIDFIAKLGSKKGVPNGVKK